jgi:hypothetical protein
VYWNREGGGTSFQTGHITVMLLLLATHSVHNTPTLVQVDDVHNLSILYDIYGAHQQLPMAVY